MLAPRQQLLAETDFTLEHIAELSGFVHPEYLSVVFKRTWGLTPGQFRVQARKTWVATNKRQTRHGELANP